MITIPFNRPCFAGKEQTYIAEAIRREHISGGGHFSQRCQTLLTETLGVHRSFLTTSCTDALEMAALLLDLQPGDEVIIPSFTFVSTVNAFVLRRAVPVFADIRGDTMNLDEAQLERLITPRTRAIVPVHYAGVGCEMDAILEIARRHGLAVVEDNAHGLFGRYRGRPLGTFGRFATLSFHETKNFTCGEGGALLLNEPADVARAEILCEKGTNRSRFFRGEVDKYTWVDVGSSFLPSDVLGAFLFAQLEERETIQRKRRRVWDHYFASLGSWAAAQGVRLPTIPPECEQSYHLFYLVLPSLDLRQRLVAHLRSRGIHAVFHYVPLHLSEMGRRYGMGPGDCPVSEDMSDRLVRLPFFNDISADDLARVTAAVCEFQVS